MIPLLSNMLHIRHLIF